MKAAVLRDKEDIAIEEVKKPVCEKDTILVRVKACGICGSDLRIYSKGDHRAKYPVILGHEISGVVEEVGINVKGFKPGDRISVAPGHGCGKCVYCKKGLENVCITPLPSVGYAYDGGFAEYFLIPEHLIRVGFVNIIPDNLSFEEATLEEPIACCINSQEKLKIGKEDIVLIFGAGPIGSIHLALSKLNGAKKVIVVDIAEDRLELIKKFNPDEIINSQKTDIMERISQITENIGVNVVIVCAPSKEAQMSGIELLAPRGRIDFFGGLHKEDSKIILDSNMVHYRELMVTGTSSSTALQNKKALALLYDKKINAKDFVTDVFPLDEIKTAFAHLRSRKAIKVVIKVS